VAIFINVKEKEKESQIDVHVKLGHLDCGYGEITREEKRAICLFRRPEPCEKTPAISQDEYINSPCRVHIWNEGESGTAVFKKALLWLAKEEPTLLDKIEMFTAQKSLDLQRKIKLQEEWIQKAKALLFDCIFCVDSKGIEQEINDLLLEGGGYDSASASERQKIREKMDELTSVPSDVVHDKIGE